MATNIDTQIQNAESRALTAQIDATYIIGKLVEAAAEDNSKDVSYTPPAVVPPPKAADSLNKLESLVTALQMADGAEYARVFDDTIKDAVPPDFAQALSELPELPELERPVFEVEVPEVVFPDLPTPLEPFSIESPELNLEFELPDAPDLDFPDAPKLKEVTLPDAPTLQEIAPPSNEAPKLDIPDELEHEYGDEIERYNDEFVKAVKSQEDDLTDKYFGGIFPLQQQTEFVNEVIGAYLRGERTTILPTGYYNTMITEARGMIDRDANATIRASDNGVAAMGFTIPNGAVYGARQTLWSQRLRESARLTGQVLAKATQIVSDQQKWAYELLAQRVTTYLEQVSRYKKELLDTTAQAISSANNTLRVAMEYLDTKIRVFNFKIDNYKSEIAIYEIKIRNAMSVVQLYQAKLSAVNSENEANRGLLDSYRAQISAAEAVIGLYKTRVEAVVSSSQLERLKIENYQAQVQAFAANAQAKDSEYRAFSAELEGELSKVKLYDSQVNAFTTRSGAYRTAAEAQKTLLDATISKNNATVEQQKAQVSAYLAAFQAAAGRLSALSQSDQAKAGVITRQSVIVETGLASELKVYDTQVEAGLRTSAGNLQAALSNAQDKRAASDKKLQSLAEGVRAATSNAAAAASSINTLIASSENV